MFSKGFLVKLGLLSCVAIGFALGDYARAATVEDEPAAKKSDEPKGKTKADGRISEELRKARDSDDPTKGLPLPDGVTPRKGMEIRKQDKGQEKGKVRNRRDVLRKKSGLKKTSGGCGDDGSAVPSPKADGPQPKYACEKTTVVLEPVWAGTKVSAKWSIKNEGQGVLDIKIKGG